MNGNWGRILIVDLSARAWRVESVPEDVYRRYVGGSGLAAWWFFEHACWEIGALDPGNPLMFMLGPASGSPFPGCSRLELCCRSPLTDIWGEASLGGHFAPQLRGTGYDGIVVTGAAVAPVYLYVTESLVEIRDGGHLWGCDTYETEDQLRDEIGDGRARVAAIGPAGENLVRFACVMSGQGSTAGRCGIGAVMGSKRLKAVVCRGRKKPPCADGDRLRELRDVANRTIRNDMNALGLREFGSNVHMEFGMAIGDVPTQNWRRGYWREGPEKLGGVAVANTILKKKGACAGCGVACKRVVEVAGGPYASGPGPGAEYEGVAALGTLQLIDELPAVTKANDLCNRYGMDVISMGSTIACATEAYTSGRLRQTVRDDLELGWGRPEALLTAIELTAHRRGLGDLLADGSRTFSSRLGFPELAMHVKGLECPMHDPRALPTLGLTYATGVRGACHCGDLNLFVDLGGASNRDIGGSPSRTGNARARAEQTMLSQVKGTLAGTAVICLYAWVSLGARTETLREVLNAITGLSYSEDELVQAAERTWYLKRCLGNLCGARADSDRLPERLLHDYPEARPPARLGLFRQVMRATTAVGAIESKRFSPRRNRWAIRSFYPRLRSLVPRLGFAPVIHGRRQRKRDFSKELAEFYQVRELDSMGVPRAARLTSLGLTAASSAVECLRADEQG